MTKKTYSREGIQVGYAGEMPAQVAMFRPSGQSWFNNHEAAVVVIRQDYPSATRVRRWTENGLQYEDYMDASGHVVVQLEFTGPPVLAAGFTYE
jgi:hypothetical protein